MKDGEIESDTIISLFGPHTFFLPTGWNIICSTLPYSFRLLLLWGSSSWGSLSWVSLPSRGCALLLAACMVLAG